MVLYAMVRFGTLLFRFILLIVSMDSMFYFYLLKVCYKQMFYWVHPPGTTTVQILLILNYGKLFTQNFLYSFFNNFDRIGFYQIRSDKNKNSTVWFGTIWNCTVYYCSIRFFRVWYITERYCFYWFLLIVCSVLLLQFC